MKKIYKTLLIVLAVLIVLVLGIAIAASPVAKNYIEKHDRELLGRSIRMERPVSYTHLRAHETDL